MQDVKQVHNGYQGFCGSIEIPFTTCTLSQACRATGRLPRGKRLIHRSPPIQPPISDGTNMPLPNVASGRTPQCKARSKRSLEQCKNPAAYGCATCRFHGARRPNTIKRGPAHPQYRHGRETKEARQRRVEEIMRLRRLVNLVVGSGFIRNRIPGRRPNSLKPSRT